MNTIEAALSLSSLVIVAAVMVGAIASLASYVSAIDIAGAAARAHAIGTEYVPPRGSVEIVEEHGLVTATATVPAALREMRATAIYPTEYR